MKGEWKKKRTQWFPSPLAGFGGSFTKRVSDYPIGSLALSSTNSCKHMFTGPHPSARRTYGRAIGRGLCCVEASPSVRSVNVQQGGGLYGRMQPNFKRHGAASPAGWRFERLAGTSPSGSASVGVDALASNVMTDQRNTRQPSDARDLSIKDVYCPF